MSNSWRVVVVNGLVLTGVLAFFAMGAEREAEQLMPSSAVCAESTDPIGRCGPHVDLQTLEANAVRYPSERTVAQLAAAYLDREQPGLASAVIDHAPSGVRARPEVAQVYARALFARGRAREALAMARDAQDSCATDDSSPATCPPWLIAKTTRQLAFLEEVVAAGIDDPYTNPEATMAAYERSSRLIGMVAMR